MGNLCCTKNATLSPEGKYLSKSFNTYVPMRQQLTRNLNSFDSIYNLEKQKLGYGSYGDVKLCIDKNLSTKKAVKIINKDYLRTANIEHSWFYNKIEILNKLDHPLIIRFHEFFEDRDFFYLLMDYHQEGDLLRHIKTRHSISEKLISSIIKQLLIAVTYMHIKKIAHRDLKPENILVSTTRGISIKLIDFDTAANFEDNGLTGTLGTYHYMAPETVNKVYDEKCDVWSCGIIMYILLTGKNNLPGLTDNQNPNKIQRVKLDFSSPIWKNVSMSAKDLLRKMLQKEPIKRISSLEALSHGWFEDIREECLDQVEALLEKIVKSVNTPLKIAAKKFVLHLKTSLDDLLVAERVFLYLDSNYDGEVTQDDFLNFFLLKHSRMEAEEMACSIMQKFGDSLEWRVFYSDFIEAAMDETILAEPENLRFFFDLLKEEDVENLNVNRILRKAKLNTGWQREEIQVWIDYLHQTKRETMDFEEFCKLVIEGISN